MSYVVQQLEPKILLSKIPPDHESVQHQVVSPPFPHFVNSPAELPVLDLPDEQEPVMEGDLHCLALFPPPDPGPVLGQILKFDRIQNTEYRIYSVLEK